MSDLSLPPIPAQFISTPEFRLLAACSWIAPPALYSMTRGVSLANDAEERGRIFELAVGAQLLQLPGELYYWRENSQEVDFVYRIGKKSYETPLRQNKTDRELYPIMYELSPASCESWRLL